MNIFTWVLSPLFLLLDWLCLFRFLILCLNLLLLFLFLLLVIIVVESLVTIVIILHIIFVGLFLFFLAADWRLLWIGHSLSLNIRAIIQLNLELSIYSYKFLILHFINIIFPNKNRNIQIIYRIFLFTLLLAMDFILKFNYFFYQLSYYTNFYLVLSMFCPFICVFNFYFFPYLLLN